jgi:hypothetical protein
MEGDRTGAEKQHQKQPFLLKGDNEPARESQTRGVRRENTGEADFDAGHWFKRDICPESSH